MRERMAYLIVIGMLILLATLMFAALGKGEYQPPPVQEQAKAAISHELL